MPPIRHVPTLAKDIKITREELVNPIQRMKKSTGPD